MKLVERMPRLCKVVIKARGGYFEESHIKYILIEHFFFGYYMIQYVLFHSFDVFTITRNPNWLYACAIVYTFMLSPHTKRDHDPQVKISKQTLNQLHSFGDRSKIIKHLWVVSLHLLANSSYLASLLLLANLSWDINIEMLFYLKYTRSSTLQQLIHT